MNRPFEEIEEVVREKLTEIKKALGLLTLVVAVYVVLRIVKYIK